MNTITFLSKLFEMYVTLGRVMGVCGVCVGRVWWVGGRGRVGVFVGRLWGVCGGVGVLEAVVEREYRSPLYYPDTLVNPDTCLGYLFHFK